MYRRYSLILLLVFPVLAFVATILFYPLALMAYRSFTDPSIGLDNYAHIVQNGAFLRILWTTLEVSAAVTLLSLLLGYPLAYAAANQGPRLRLVLIAAVTMPFWTSLLVRTYAWLVILRPEGPLADFLRYLGYVDPPQLLFNRVGAIVGMVYVMIPYMVLSLLAVMDEIDPSLHRAARSLGASPLRAFLSVYLPHSYPGITGGALLVFIISLGFFVTPALLGGRQEIFVAQFIQINVQQVVNWGFASALAVVLLAITMILLFIYDRLLRGESVLAPSAPGSNK